MAGHHHGDIEPTWRAPVLTRRLLALTVVGAAIGTVAGLLILWPHGEGPRIEEGELGFSQQADATVLRAERGRCTFAPEDPTQRCEALEVRVTSGDSAGDRIELEHPVGPGVADLTDGDLIILGYEPTAPPEFQYQFVDFQRRQPVLVLAALFAGVVLIFGRLRGLLALAGLAASLLVLTIFVLPALLRGSDPLGVAIVGSSAVAFMALYLAHGFNVRTSVALLGTLVSLLLVAALAAVFTSFSHFTGLSSEEASFLQLTLGEVDLRGLLLAGMVIGSLGVLDDVTVTQVSAVSELHRTDPDLGAADLYRSAVRIGRDHIASAVNTLVLAYAGAALPLLLLVTEAARPLSTVLTSETVAIEIVRTLVGSIGLVASVPLTTGLAAVVIGRSKRPRSQSRDRQEDPAEDATWEQFAPDDYEAFWQR